MTKTYAPIIPAQLARELNIAFASSDAQTICRAIGEAVHKFNIAELSRETGLHRTSIHRAFSSGEQLPNFDCLGCPHRYGDAVEGNPPTTSEVVIAAPFRTPISRISPAALFAADGERRDNGHQFGFFLRRERRIRFTIRLVSASMW